jgi:hypothetical protein
MPKGQIDVRTALRKSLGATRPPEKITQEAYAQNSAHLRRLARLQSGERPEGSDLFDYMEDLRYTEIQSSLLIYLLPICLEVWRNDLRGFDSSYGGVVEHFYPVLADRHVFDVHLKKKQSETVSQFMRHTILDEIDDQRGLSYEGATARPYRWFSELTTYGVLVPDMDRLWTAWWSLSTMGRAVAAIQYISCLMYPENENRIFAPWTRDGGGGPPCLWEFAGHLYAHRWLEANVAFLRSSLGVHNISDVLTIAVSRLADEPEHSVAARIQEDFPLCEATVRTRCGALPRFLETKQEAGRDFEWPAS